MPCYIIATRQLTGIARASTEGVPRWRDERFRNGMVLMLLALLKPLLPLEYALNTMTTHDQKNLHHPSNKKELGELKTKIKELEDGWRRTQADFENFRRHVESERQETARFGVGQMMLKLVPILDNFRRSAAHIPADQQNSEWIKGVQLIEKQLETTLKEEGLEEIVGEGEFNPHLHEAISHESHATIPENHVIAVVESGWKVGEKVLRPAKVRVSSGTAEVKR